jgi:hypothetical protein
LPIIYTRDKDADAGSCVWCVVLSAGWSVLCPCVQLKCT